MDHAKAAKATRKFVRTMEDPVAEADREEMKSLLRAVLMGEDILTDPKWMKRALALTAD